MSFKDDISKMDKEELLEELVKLSAIYLDEYDGELLQTQYESLIRDKLECSVCGKLDGNNHDELSHKANSDYTGVG